MSAGADPGFEKGGAQGIWGLAPKIFDPFRGLFREFGAKRGGRAPPSGSVGLPGE